MSLDNPFVPSHDPRIGCSFDYVKEKKKKKKNFFQISIQAKIKVSIY